MKSLYLLLFKIRYILNFTRQHDKSVLFINEFDSHEAIDKNISYYHYNKMYINPKTSSMKAQIKAIKKAKYIFCDNYYVGFAAINKKNKVVTQIWHADGAVKKFGLADEANTQNPKDIERYKKVYNSFDNVVVSSDFMAECFKSAFEITSDKILNVGYPKMDNYYSVYYNEERENVMQTYPKTMEKISILYMPTFRKNQADNDKQVEFIKYLAENLDSKYHLFFHLHPSIKVPEINYKNVSPILNEDVVYFYSLANLVISDYSSIIFEVSKFNIPIVNYLYDYEMYSASPGLFLEIDQMPGNTFFYKEEVAKYINDGLETVDNSEFYNKYNQYVEGKSGRDIVLSVLGGNN